MIKPQKSFRSVAIAMFSGFSLLSFEQGIGIWMPLSSNIAQADSSQYQESSITLSTDDLSEPNILSVYSEDSLSYLSGSISCNGRVITTLGTQETQVNLAPYLIQGRNTVTVSGSYSPMLSTVEVEFIGPSHQVQQAMAGNGSINQNLVLYVQD